MNTGNIEFSIISYKYPSVIAHNILSLFGAADLYKTQYRRNEKKILAAMDHFPDDIMQDVYAKNIFNLSIGEYTWYLINWKQNLDPAYDQLLTDKMVNY